MALSATATDYYYNSFRNNNGNTEAAGNQYYVLYDGTYALYTSPGTWHFENTTFINTHQTGGTHGDSAIYVDADGRIGQALFSGSGLVVTSSRAAATSSQGVSIRNGGIVYLASSTIAKINTSTDTSEGVYITDKSRFHGEDITIIADAPRVRGISLASGADTYLSLNRASVSSTGSAAALNFAGIGYATLASTTLATTGPSAPGVQFNYGLARLDYDGGAIRATGADSPGIWAGINNASVHIIANLKNLDIRSAAAAALDINTHLPNMLGPTPAQNSNYGLYEFTIENSTLEGAPASLRLTSLATSPNGSTIADIPTTLHLALKNTTLRNDIFVHGRAQLHLDMRAGALEGALHATAATTITGTLADTTITGALDLADTATLRLSLDHATIASGLTAAADATATLRLANTSTLAGHITLADQATLDLRIDATSTLTDSILIAPRATLTLATTHGAPLPLPGLTLAGHLRAPTGLTLAGPLNLVGDTATLTLTLNGKNPSPALTLDAGVTGTATLIIETLAPATLGQPSIHLIDDRAATTNTDTFTLAGGELDLGLTAYTLENRPGGAWLIGGPGPRASAIGAMLNTHAAAATDWFHALQPVHDHLATLRAPAPGAQDPAPANPRATTLWARVRTSRLTVEDDGALPAYDQTTTGLTTGATATWPAPAGSTLAAGFYAASHRTARDLAGATDGTTIDLAAGLYTAWRHPVGWFAAASARFDAYKHKYDTHAPAHIRADYHTQAIGATLELGRHLAPPSRAWWLEPSLQASLVSLDGARYTPGTAASGPLLAIDDARVQVASARALQTRLRAAAGYNPPGSRLRFHGQLAAAHTRATGGEVRVHLPRPALLPAHNPDLLLDRQLEGWQAEALAGFTFDLGRAGHLTCDYQYTRADDYTLPWTLSLGWSLSW